MMIGVVLDLIEKGNIEIGSKVTVRKSEWENTNNLTGSVVYINEDWTNGNNTILGIRFEDPVGDGHSCGERCTYGHGYYIACGDMVKVHNISKIGW